MTKTILITGSTDGIGLATAKLLAESGHTLLLHGRNEAKLEKAKAMVATVQNAGDIEAYQADISCLADVEALATTIADKHSQLDVLVNNAGVYVVPTIETPDGLDTRFVVNTISPYLLTKRLIPIVSGGRVVNVASAAQAPVDLNALSGLVNLGDSEAYAQSKLALIMWSLHMAKGLTSEQASIIALNPSSFLASKMVKDAYGIAGNDLSIGAEIIAEAALGERFTSASGKYFDNDKKAFSAPHPAASDSTLNEALVGALESILSRIQAR